MSVSESVRAGEWMLVLCPIGINPRWIQIVFTLFSMVTMMMAMMMTETMIRNGLKNQLLTYHLGSMILLRRVPQWLVYQCGTTGNPISERQQGAALVLATAPKICLGQNLDTLQPYGFLDNNSIQDKRTQLYSIKSYRLKPWNMYSSCVHFFTTLMLKCD